MSVEDNVINLADRLKAKPPSWGATVTIAPDGNGVTAELTAFYGDDPNRDPAQRCRLFADALLRLSQQLFNTADGMEAGHE